MKNLVPIVLVFGLIVCAHSAPNNNIQDNAIPLDNSVGCDNSIKGRSDCGSNRQEVPDIKIVLIEDDGASSNSILDTNYNRYHYDYSRRLVRSNNAIPPPDCGENEGKDCLTSRVARSP